ncbi:MAG: hypothetical protein GX131_18580 [candidate division WS1 bacterium]|jgi:hypothetical protein|nr:hypothetical protein [candidate division WS1 bacterium]
MKMVGILAVVILVPMGCSIPAQDETTDPQEPGQEAIGAEVGATTDSQAVDAMLDDETRQWLQTEFDRQMVQLQEQYPTTEEQRAQYRELVMSPDPERRPDDQASWKVVREDLPQALPVIYDILHVAEGSIRVEAVRSISLPDLPESLAALPNWRDRLNGIEPALEPGLLMLLLTADDPERGLRMRTAIFAGHMLALNRLAERDRESSVLSERTGQTTLEVLRRMATSDPDPGVRDASQRALYRAGEGPPPESGIL